MFTTFTLGGDNNIISVFFTLQCLEPASMDFCQTFVISATKDKCELVEF